ncbi:endonuclease/exonuclease/phosphatase family protein [Nocardioides zhouii]|uniref:Endonuclease/exonuclease/phosphatase family protein n=1 Tax=Nocardioides zhouii TaxID=1168729 RepID=A0A4Q2T0R1_9ACTN|nr:endonuclease/exonuclease/phosphatase family protein [Nocardioides zhouii]RYC10494.1 endonuclease/exonuclease/phosphatase family protein [Nocardioides zhouii]
MRTGTWNLAGRWSDAHLELMIRADCDVWLLTEVNLRTELPGHDLHLGVKEMAPKRRWAGIATRLSMTPAADPHGASALARIGGTTYVSSILPWKGCGSAKPWVGERHVDKTENAVAELVENLRSVESLVWGGDWNNALTGREYAGSIGGRRAILSAVDELRLEVPTTGLPHAIPELLTIDHIAVPRAQEASAARFVAEHDGNRLSDHDVYVVEAN